MRVVFAGTPVPALPSLEALLASPHEVVGVVTRPDAPAGRGRRAAQSPVAVRALAAGVPLLQPASARDPEFVAGLAELAPDACAIVAYGALLPPAALDVPPLGWVNLHFSLLPAWRGAAPVQQALLAGDDVTGATTFRLDAGMDTGAVLGQLTTAVRARETSGELLDRLADDGARLLLATLDGLDDGSLVAVPQSDDGVSHAAKVTADDARVRWSHPALAVDRRVRACTPAPGAWTTWRGERLKLAPVELVGADAPGSGEPALAPGEVALTAAGVLVGTATAPVRLGEVQPAGRRAMPAVAWARGARPEAGERLGRDAEAGSAAARIAAPPATGQRGEDGR